MRFDSLSLIHKVRPLDIFHNQPVTDAIKNLNGCNKVSSITCFEFSTPLQKSIPYCKLISVLNEHIDFCFKGGDGEFIAVYKKGSQSHNKISFTKTSLKKAVKHLLKKCNFKLGNIIFRQNYWNCHGFWSSYMLSKSLFILLWEWIDPEGEKHWY